MQRQTAVTPYGAPLELSESELPRPMFDGHQAEAQKQGKERK